MAKARLISKSIGCSGRFNALADEIPEAFEFAQLLFVLLIPHTDDFGRMSADPFSVKMNVLPASSRQIAEFNSALRSLHQVGLLTVYQVKSDIWLQVNKFEDHQTGLHKRTTSSIPAIPKDNSGNFPEVPGNSGSRARAEENRTETKRRETNIKIKAVPTAQNRASKERNPRTPDQNLRVITKIAHEVISQNGYQTDADAMEAVKLLCAKRHIAYNSEVVRKALESAEVQSA